MIELLFCGEKLSIAELSEEFNVSARTIRRDLKQRIAHLPVVCENGFYFLDYTNYNIKKYDLIKFSKKSGILDSIQMIIMLIYKTITQSK
ncbi:DeoR family transcriptional regulator [Campylobacter geochelonis]|uniref:DeoR family transcriptional regulator n=1 Tax=Campylobacter geochelonis TaxID=1780362 RepID=UPI003BF7EF14